MSGICTIAHITLLCGFVWRYGSRYPTWRFVWLRPTSGRNFSDSFKWITWSPKGSLSEVEMYYLDRVIVAKLRCEIGVRVSNLLLYFTTRRDHSTILDFFLTSISQRNRNLSHGWLQIESSYWHGTQKFT